MNAKSVRSRRSGASSATRRRSARCRAAASSTSIVSRAPRRVVRRCLSRPRTSARGRSPVRTRRASTPSSSSSRCSEASPAIWRSRSARAAASTSAAASSRVWATGSIARSSGPGSSRKAGSKPIWASIPVWLIKPGSPPALRGANAALDTLAPGAAVTSGRWSRGDAPLRKLDPNARGRSRHADRVGCAGARDAVDPDPRRLRPRSAQHDAAGRLRAQGAGRRSRRRCAAFRVSRRPLQPRRP